MTKVRLLVLLAAALPLFAQTTSPRRLPVGETLLSLPSAQIPTQGLWEVKFTHRFNQSLSDGSFSDQWHSLFGLDTNADVTFGVSYAMKPNLLFSLARTNTNDTVELASKYVLLQQSETRPLTLALRGGADLRTERDLEDRNSFFAQAIVARRLGEKTEVYALPTFVTDAGRAVTGDVSGAMFEHAFNVPLGVVYSIRGPLMLVAEVIPPNGDVADETDADFGWSLGIKRAIGGHWFEILLTNNQSTTADQYVTSTFQGTGLDAGDVKLGFNIERRFGRRK
jgi:hypothetical protein